MGFWIFMLIFILLIPLCMFGIGHSFTKTHPGAINTGFGYRTTRAMKSPEAWAFAHHHCGNTWRKAGLIMLPISVVAMLFTLGKSLDFTGIYACVLCGIQMVTMLVSIIPTERALKREFDEHGNRCTSEGEL